MMHIMLRYLEVVTNLDFIKVTIMPLELKGGIVINFDTAAEDSAYLFSVAEIFRRECVNLNHTRLQINNKNLIVDDVKIFKISIDKVT